MEKIRNILATNLRRLRGERTQAQVAVDCGVEIPTYNRWEKEKAWPDPTSVQAIADYYKIDPSELYRSLDIVDKPQPLPKLSFLASALRSIPDEVFELAQQLEPDNDIWEDVIAMLEVGIEEKIEEEKERKNHA